MRGKAAIVAVEYSVPERVLDNEELARRAGAWSAKRIESKIGIRTRYITSEDRTSLDLGVSAAEKLFKHRDVDPEQIDFLLFCTQSPDYFFPTTACLAHQRLGLRNDCGALDFNLGCSGYVYGLFLARGMIDSGQAESILLITAETYSKFIDSEDTANLTIFGDGAAATLICNRTGNSALGDVTEDYIGPFVMGTDGSGAENLIVRDGGMRYPISKDSNGNVTNPSLFMNGPEIFSFSIREVPAAVSNLLHKSGRSIEDVDLFVFHQANRYMLEHLRKKIGIPADKFVFEMANFGNTVSATIPIALREAERHGQLQRGMEVMLVGFGVGYSWGATLVKWTS